MSYEHYRNLMPLPYPNAAGSDASACQAVASVHLPPANATAAPSHAEEMAEIERLLFEANNARWDEDDVPLFLRQARRA